MVSGAFWFAIFIVGHALFFHWYPRAKRFGTIALTFLLALIGHGATALLPTRQAQWLGQAAHGGLPVVTVVGALEMVAFAVLYLPFYYTVNTSLSVQIMIRIAHAPDRTLPEVAVRAMLMSEELLSGRLGSLVEAGYMRREGERYILTPKGRRLGRIFRSIRAWWRLGAGG